MLKRFRKIPQPQFNGWLEDPVRNTYLDLVREGWTPRGKKFMDEWGRRCGARIVEMIYGPELGGQGPQNMRPPEGFRGHRKWPPGEGF